MDELLLFTLTSPSLHIRQAGSFLQFLLTSSPLNSDGRAPIIYIDELFPQPRWTSFYYSQLTGPPLHIRQAGSFLLFTLTSPLLHFKQTGSFLLFTLTSPLLHFEQTGSFLQFTLTSYSKQLYLTSSYYSHGRALTTVYLTSSSKQLYLTSSSKQLY